MKLSDVVQSFATETFTSYRDVGETFKGILHVQVDGAGSGPNTTRRIIEAPNTETVPTEREIVDNFGLEMVLGHEMLDHYQGELVRKKYPVLVCNAGCSIGPVSEALSGVFSLTDVLVYPEFQSKKSDEEEKSSYNSSFLLLISSYYEASIDENTIIKIGDSYYRVNAKAFVDGAGFLAIPAYTLSAPLQQIDHVAKGDYDEVADSYDTTTTSVAGFVEPLRLNYHYSSPDYEKVEAGDLAISTLGTVSPGDTLAGRRVIAVYDRGSFYTSHCRK